MPQTKEVQREQARLRKQKQRDRERDNATENVTVDVTPLPSKVTNILRADEQGKYPAIVYALTDPIKKKKLEQVHQSLKIHKQAENVYYGYPRLGGIPFDVIGDLLEATQ